MIRRTELTLRVLLFGVAIWLPLAAQLGVVPEPDVPAPEENRRPAERPPFVLSSALLDRDRFRKDYDAWYADHFGFRGPLMRYSDLLQVELFGTSRLTKVVVGTEGWFYFAGPLSRHQFRTPPLFPPAALERWRRLLERRRDAAPGGRYLLVLVPDKRAIYPEHLPRTTRRPGRVTRLSQLVAYLREHSDVPVLDLTGALRSAREAERVYHPTDTHWNPRGAYHGYTAIVAALAPWFRALTARPRSDYREEPRRYEGDLTRMLGVGDRYPEQDVLLIPRGGTRSTRVRVAYQTQAWPEWLPERWGFAHTTPGSKGPRAVLFRDSFATYLVPFLAESFSRLTCYWQHDMDAEVLRRERPDVVLQEMEERALYGPIPER